MNALYQWVVGATSGFSGLTVVWGQQDAPRPPAPAITLRISNIAEIGQTELDTASNPLVIGTSGSITIGSLSGSTFTATNHGLLTGDGQVTIASSGTLPSPLVANTPYWVIVLGANTFQLASDYGNTGGGQGAGNPTTPITLTSAGSGTFTLSSNSKTLRAGQEILEIARGYLRVTLELHAHAAPGVGLNMATSILQAVRTRSKWSSQRAILKAANIAYIRPERIRAVTGVRDALLFEPRAYMDLQFCMPTEESTTSTIIETTQVAATVDDVTGSEVADFTVTVTTPVTDQ